MRSQLLLRCCSELASKSLRASSFSTSTAAYAQPPFPPTSDDFVLERLTGTHQGIVLFRFNRPKVMNALGKHFMKLFATSMDEIKFDRSCRVLILKSDVPGAFCAGADLKERAQMTPEEVPILLSGFRRLIGDLETLPVPVIAAIDGVALGGGLEMALATDIRIAAENAKIGLTETRLAIIPGGGGTQRLPRIVGRARAKEMIFTGRILSGSEAANWGVVNHSVPQNDAGDAAYRKALQIAEQIIPNGPVALRVAKLAINNGMETDLQSGLILEQSCYAETIPTSDRMEGLTAFKEKRKPVYRGE